MHTVRKIEDLFLVLDEGNILRRFGLSRIGVFGSFARGEEFKDIDLFIEEDLDFRQLLLLKETLERETGLPVDIMQKKYAEPVILHRAQKDMKYAAVT